MTDIEEPAEEVRATTALHEEESRSLAEKPPSSNPWVKNGEVDEQQSTATSPHIHPLVELQQQFPQGLALSPPLGELIISSLLQVLALGVAVAFGVYAVKSVRVASEANSFAVQALAEARLANQIAMLSICTSMKDDVRRSHFIIGIQFPRHLLFLNFYIINIVA